MAGLVAACMPPPSDPGQSTTTTDGETVEAAKRRPPSGGVPFTSSSLWNSTLPQGSWVDNPGLRAAPWWVNDESYSIPVVYSSASDPVVAVQVPATWGWPADTLSLPIPAGVTGAQGTDGSIVIVANNVAYNFWQFQRTDTTHATANAYGEANTVTGTGWGSSNPFLGAGIRAAGSSAVAGLITGSDLAGSVIHHALAVSLPGSLLSSAYVAPAISSDGGGGPIPMGARLGIPAGTPMPAGLSPIGQTVWNTLLTYGAFVVDQHNDSAPAILYADPNSVPTSTIEPLRSGDLNLIMPYVRIAQ